MNDLPQLDSTAWLLVAINVSDEAELQEVTTDAPLCVEDLEAVFAAAPRLQVLNAKVTGDCVKLLPFLRNDPPYGPLRISEVCVDLFLALEEGGVLALAAAFAETHEPVRSLHLRGMSARGVNALVDAATERRVISSLNIDGCEWDTESIAALARLLRRGSLTYLVGDCNFPHAQEENMLELCAALRDCRTLTHLTLMLDPPGGASCRVVTGLLDAVAAPPALSVLDLSVSELQDKANAGRAFGALLSANMPSLRMLHVLGCHLGDEGLAPLLDGLAANTHLRELRCNYNDPSEAFRRGRLEPMLAALAARPDLDA